MIAFLKRKEAEAESIRSDGAKLYAHGDLVAEWDGNRVQIRDGDSPPAMARCKALLRDLIQWEDCRTRVIRTHLRGGYARSFAVGSKGEQGP
jgi:hypothetical protein